MKNKEKYTDDEMVTIANKMIKYGGSFVKGLGELYFHADVINKKKLFNAFSGYFHSYFIKKFD